MLIRQARLISDLAASSTCAEIAEKTGLNYQTVWAHCRANNIQPVKGRGGRKHDRARLERMAAAIRSGVTTKQVAGRFGTTPASVKVLLHKYGFPISKLRGYT